MSSLFLFLAKLLCRREVQEMAVVYATLIIKGRKTMEQVPERLKADVADILDACEIKL